VVGLVDSSTLSGPVTEKLTGAVHSSTGIEGMLVVAVQRAKTHKRRKDMAAKKARNARKTKKATRGLRKAKALKPIAPLDYYKIHLE
jgi:hypothetical protein